MEKVNPQFDRYQSYQMPLPTEERQKEKNPIELQEPGIDNQRLSERSRYNQMGYQKFQEKEYLQAESMFRAALATFKESEKESESFALANCRLGKTCLLQEKYDDSEIAFLRAVTCFLRIGVCDQNLATAQETLGEMYYLQNRYADAEKAFKYVLVTYNSLNTSSEKLGNIRSNLGVVLRVQEKHAEAEKVFRIAARDYSKGKVDVGLGKAQLGLGVELVFQKKYEEALEALRSAEKAFEEVGADIILKGDAKHNQAIVHWHLGEDAEALDAFVLALSCYQAGGERAAMRFLDTQALLHRFQRAKRGS